MKEDVPAFGPEAPRSLVVGCGDSGILSPLGQTGKFFMSAEVFRLDGNSMGPAFHTGAKLPVDVLISPLGCGVSAAADLVEDAAGSRLLFRFIAQKGVFESDMRVVWIKLHSLSEAIARE